jgi:FtsZ-interacting cell division protein YlmF
MGFMNFLYKLFGFESDDVRVVAKKKNSHKATYNLKVKQDLPDEIDGVRVYYPENFDECKEKVELLKKNTPFFLDFRGCSTNDKNKALDYMSGVMSVLESNVEQVDKNLYIFLPKNMKIERE